VNGDRSVPLHGYEFGQKARQLPMLFDPMGDFFRRPDFLRLAVTAYATTTLPSTMAIMTPVVEVLKKQMLDYAQASSCDSVAVVFESSERADAALVDQFGNLEVLRGGKEIPVEHCFIEKKFHDPLAEIADFVVNAAGSMARWRLLKRDGFPKDFAAIFQSIPRELVKYLDIGSVTGRTDEELVHGLELG
jgi:hypothetical protein